MYVKLIISKQLTINKCTLLDFTNTEIRTVYTEGSRLRFGIPYTHSFGTDTHTSWSSLTELNPSFQDCD